MLSQDFPKYAALLARRDIHLTSPSTDEEGVVQKEESVGGLKEEVLGNMNLGFGLGPDGGLSGLGGGAGGVMWINGLLVGEGDLNPFRCVP